MATKATKKNAEKKPVPSGLKIASQAKECRSQFRKSSGISVRLFSRLTGFSERTIAGWEAGDSISESTKRRLLESQRFLAQLAQIVDEKSIPAWLDTPNEAFNGLKPIEVIERGEIDRLWSMLFYLESGMAS